MTRIMPIIAGKTHNSRHIHLNIDLIKEERENHMIRIVMIKYALKRGLNNFKEQGEAAVMK